MTFTRHTAPSFAMFAFTMFAFTMFAFAMAAMPLIAQFPATQAPTTQARPDHGLRAGRAGRQMNLTEAQKASIKAIRDKHHSGLALRRDAARQAHAALQAAMQDPTASEAQLRALHDKASAARFDLMLAQRSLRQEVQAILTPEQRAKAAERRAAVKARRQERLRHLGMAAGMPG